MAQVTVSIGGRQYRMACEDGQEDHLTALAERLDRSIGELRRRFGNIDDQRLTVMAAITFADRQADAERRLEDAEARVADGEDARAATEEARSANEAGVASALDEVAGRIEALAARVSGAPLIEED